MRQWQTTNRPLVAMQVCHVVHVAACANADLKTLITFCITLEQLYVKYIFGFVLLSLASSLEKETTPLNHEDEDLLLAGQIGICWDDHMTSCKDRGKCQRKHTTVRSARPSLLKPNLL